jgi:hypothetical protein
MTKKSTYWLSGILMAGLLAVAGCGKSEKAVAQQPSAAMDFTKFRQAFPTPTPEQNQAIAKVSGAIRYRQYVEVLMALDQLGSDASLTDAQKKAVNGFIEGIKQAMTNAPAAPPQ